MAPDLSTETADAAVWYAAYGSNLHARRFNYYLEGGSPPGTSRTYPGFRDPTPPRASRALTLPGTVYFAWESPVWTGGVAFYAPGRVGDRAAARGYLLTAGQFDDLLAQEMYRAPGSCGPLDLDAVVREGVVRLGGGRYETVLCVGELDGSPILTFTAPWDPAAVELRRPSSRYLNMLAAGLRESHGWTPGQIYAYLAELSGVQGFWDIGELRALIGS